MKRALLSWLLLCCICCFATSVVRAQASRDTLPFRLTADVVGDTAKLRWANLGSSVRYDIHRLMPQEESFQQLHSTVAEVYDDVISRSVCRDTVKYYVAAVVGDTFYKSNTMALFFEDPNPTTACEVQLASVNRATQLLELSWTACPDEDAMGYVIHKGSNGSNQGSLWRPYDTVWGRETTHYVCHDLNLAEVHAFRIFAFDSCFQASPLTAPYQNITLKTELPECSRELHLSWTSYINMPDELSHYDVLLQIDGGEWYTLTTRNTHQPQWYDHTLPDDCREASLLVRAVSLHGHDTAWSNLSTVQLQTIGRIGYLSMDKATVSDDNNAVVLTATVDSSFVTEGYNLYRRQWGGEWSRIDVLPYTGESTVHYEDHTATPSSIEHFYRLGVPDACMGMESYSEEVNNVLLTAASAMDNDELVQLAWTAFVPWSGTVQYNLLRKQEGAREWQSLVQTASCSYIDDLSLCDSIGGAWLYKVIAHGHDTLQSNTVRYAAEVTLWLPNAIVPQQQENGRFCVKGKHISPLGYELYIYNRLGQQIYHSTDPADCWDGTHQGLPVPQAAYMYLLKYRNDEGKECIEKGTVTVLR